MMRGGGTRAGRVGYQSMLWDRAAELVRQRSRSERKNTDASGVGVRDKEVDQDRYG